MTKKELSKQYREYLNTIANMSGKKFNFRLSHYKGILHGLGIALDYDYETIERDIAHAMLEPMQGQTRLIL